MASALSRKERTTPGTASCARRVRSLIQVPACRRTAKHECSCRSLSSPLVSPLPALRFLRTAFLQRCEISPEFQLHLVMHSSSPARTFVTETAHSDHLLETSLKSVR